MAKFWLVTSNIPEEGALLIVEGMRDEYVEMIGTPAECRAYMKQKGIVCGYRFVKTLEDIIDLYHY